VTFQIVNVISGCSFLLMQTLGAAYALYFSNQTKNPDNDL